MARFEDIGLFLRPPDFRSRRRVESEIAEELEFHLACAARSREESGMDPDAARAAAEAAFGDLESIRRACARIQIGEWRVLQRIQLGLMVVLLGAVGYFGWQLASARAQTTELVGELRGEIGALAEALRESRGEVRAADSAFYTDTDGDGLPDARTGPDSPARSTAASQPTAPLPSVDDWLARFDSNMRWSEVKAIGDEIAALDPALALPLILELYPRLPTAFARQQILKSFVFDGGHPLALEVLHLAATDPELAVQGFAFTYLKDWAFQDFSDDHDAYLAWRARFADVPLAELLTRNAQELVQRLGALEGAELARELRRLEDLDLSKGPPTGVDLAEVMRSAGMLDEIRTWIAAADAESRRTAVAWLRELRPDEAWLRLEVAPLLRSGPEAQLELIGAACDALAAQGATWAVDPLVDSLRWARPDEPTFVFDHARALAEIGDARVIPTLIALIAADDTYDTIYGLGYFALEPLTGVSYDESHDGAFWREWWAENRARLPIEVRDLEIPALTFRR